MRFFLSYHFEVPRRRRQNSNVSRQILTGRIHDKTAVRCWIALCSQRDRTKIHEFARQLQDSRIAAEDVLHIEVTLHQYKSTLHQKSARNMSEVDKRKHGDISIVRSVDSSQELHANNQNENKLTRKQNKENVKNR